MCCLLSFPLCRVGERTRRLRQAVVRSPDSFQVISFEGFAGFRERLLNVAQAAYDQIDKDAPHALR